MINKKRNKGWLWKSKFLKTCRVTQYAVTCQLCHLCEFYLRNDFHSQTKTVHDSRIFKMETKNMVTGLLQGVQPCCLEFRYTLVSVTEATPHVLKVLFSTTTLFKKMVKGGSLKNKNIGNLWHCFT